MKIVVDTSRIIAATIRDGLSRTILFSEKFDFFSPEYTLTEIDEHRNEIMEKAELNEDEYGVWISFILERVNLTPSVEYESFIKPAKFLIKDMDDVPIFGTLYGIEGGWCLE